MSDSLKRAYVTDMGGQVRAVRVKEKVVQPKEKPMTKEKLARLSKKYRIKLDQTTVDHENFPVITRVITGLLDKANESGLLGHKAKQLYKKPSDATKLKMLYLAILKLTSRQ